MRSAELTSAPGKADSPLVRGLFWLGTAALVGIVLAGAAAAHAGWARFALVIGYNQSDDAALSPLRYADDDAVKYAELFDAAGQRTVLLADLDEETRQTFPKAKIAGRPTRENVLKGLASLRESMAAARRQGHQPLLYFVYSGHGNYDAEGRGYVHLAGSRFTTRDLFFYVLGPTEGETPHHAVLIVDACNAALLVNSRGSDKRKVTGTTLKLEAYPKVGVVLSSSTVGEVHEWGKYLSGIFSHEVRSGLLGPADLDDDGAVDFVELAAFVQSANAEVKNAQYRVKPYIRPPLDQPNLRLVALDEGRFPARVRVPAGAAGKGFLVNRELVRWADFHKPARQQFWLGIPNGEGFSLVMDGREYLIAPSARGALSLASLDSRPATAVAAKGPSAYFEERLFARPHESEDARKWAMDRYLESLLVERYELVPWYKNAGAWSVFGTGLVAFGAGIGFAATAYGARDQAAVAEWADERRRLNDQALRDEKIGGALLGIGAAGLLGSALWFALDRRMTTETYRPPLSVELTPGGVRLKTTF